jgi:hypothetical protein
MNTPGTLTIKSQQDDSGQLLIWSWMLALEFLQRSWTNSSIHFLTSKLERTGMGWRSASRSYNRMTAVCGLTLTRNQDRYFVSLYPLNVLRTKRRSCAIVNNVKVK